MGRKETEEAIADCRAGRVTRFGSVDELLADLKAGEYPLPPSEREWVNAPAVGREPLTPYDPAEPLTTADAVAAFLADAEATADPAYIEHAREVAARARTMHGIK